jgi:NADH-quinone oxidoreductase subunit F
MLEILERITTGQGVEGDIELLIELGETIRDTAMCGLGQTAPNPVLSYNQILPGRIRRAHQIQVLPVGRLLGTLHFALREHVPANVNVPGYLNLVAAGRFIDAYNLIARKIPFRPSADVFAQALRNKCRAGRWTNPSPSAN